MATTTHNRIDTTHTYTSGQGNTQSQNNNHKIGAFGRIENKPQTHIRVQQQPKSQDLSQINIHT
jgi:hypothetical protein